MAKPWPPHLKRKIRPSTTPVPAKAVPTKPPTTGSPVKTASSPAPARGKPLTTTTGEKLVSWQRPDPVPPGKDGPGLSAPPCSVCHAKAVGENVFRSYVPGVTPADIEIRVRVNTLGRTQALYLCYKHLRRLQMVVNGAVDSLG